jgi:transcriptional regulator with PAS, ATPase and Fis domain
LLGQAPAPTPPPTADPFSSNIVDDFVQHEELSEYNQEQTPAEPLSLQEQEKEMIKRALVKYHGKRKPAAAELGISERTLYRKIKEFSLEDY